MRNPWLQIPAADYEAHMSLPEVAQAQALAGLLASALKEYTPSSLAVFGCTTGNGFEHIDASRTRRVVGVDINPEYLAILGSRFRDRFPGLELIKSDFAHPEFRLEPVAMIFAGLIFEYVAVRDALLSIARCLEPGGTMVAALQLPSTESAPVTATQYRSLELLAPLMQLVPPEEFVRGCDTVGLHRLRADRLPLKKGKALYVGHFRKDAEPESA